MPVDFVKFPELRNSQFDLYYLQSPHKQIVEDFWADVVRIQDGDTITLRTSFRDFDFPLRLARIDAPELNEIRGEQSQKWLEGKLRGAFVLVKIDPANRVEKWGRLLGDVIHNGVSVSEESEILGHSVNFADREDPIRNINIDLEKEI